MILKSYELDSVGEFYPNYVATNKNMTPSGKDNNIRKQSQLDMVRVRDHEVDIPVKSICMPFWNTFLSRLRRPQNTIFRLMI